MKEKVEPIIYLGLDEGAGVDDLDIVGLMHHQSLDVSLPPPPSLFASPILSSSHF